MQVSNLKQFLKIHKKKMNYKGINLGKKWSKLYLEILQHFFSMGSVENKITEKILEDMLLLQKHY